MVDGTWHTLDPGESQLVRRSIPHLYRNGHDSETLFTARFTPARQFLRFFLNMSLNTANHPSGMVKRVSRLWCCAAWLCTPSLGTATVMVFLSDAEGTYFPSRWPGIDACFPAAAPLCDNAY
jgi:hypothetical protein